MSKPTQTFTWATDATIAAGPEAGQSTRAVPPAALAAQGWKAGDKPVARHVNHLFGLTSEWIDYLESLETDPQFLANNFAWTGDHTFALNVTANDVASFSGLTSSSNVLAQPDIVRYETPGGSVEPRVRGIMLNPASGRDLHPSTSALHGVYAQILPTGDPPHTVWFIFGTTSIIFPIELPDFSQLARVRLGLKNTHASEVRSVSAQVIKNVYNKTTVNATPYQSVGGTFSIGLNPGQLWIHTVQPFDAYVDNSQHSLNLVCRGQADIALHWVEVVFYDHGFTNV